MNQTLQARARERRKLRKKASPIRRLAGEGDGKENSDELPRGQRRDGSASTSKRTREKIEWGKRRGMGLDEIKEGKE